ncbi:MAG TPA: DUF2231 domain-containing protein [Opitutaceae bacterium]
MPAAREILQGRPFKSPLHPALVHLPIGLFPLSLLLDLASWAVDRPDWQLGRAAFICLVAGLATGLLAGITGMIDYTDIREDHPSRKTATVHMLLNLIALGVFALGAGLRLTAVDAPRTPLLPVIISALGVGLITFPGYLGGHLVYNDGIGVGRHRRPTRTPRSTITLHAPAGEKVMVARADALAIGETLRIDAAGTIVAVARTPEGVFAFQEYCPHRYGPLSEGRIEGCEVTCPWHGSRFDVRDGRVTQGPAKIDLRRFRVEIRDGTLWLEMPRRT